MPSPTRTVCDADINVVMCEVASKDAGTRRNFRALMMFEMEAIVGLAEIENNGCARPLED